jgi:hypothetical protein
MTTIDQAIARRRQGFEGLMERTGFPSQEHPNSTAFDKGIDDPNPGGSGPFDDRN